MTYLILGLIIWSAAHLFSRVMGRPKVVAGPTPAYIVTSLLIIFSVVVMVIGYRAADGTVYWGRSAPLVGINNLLMILAFYCYAASAAKGVKIWLARKIRHPQLTGFGIWAVAHILVNGDTPSFVLFGGLLVWAIVQTRVINAADGPWEPLPPAPMKKEIVAIVVTLIVTCVVMGIHYALGVTPWG